MKKYLFLLFFLSQLFFIANATDPFIADSSIPRVIPNMDLVWSDEFNKDGKPNPANWIYENGFVRNEELQWYQPDNVNVSNGLLVFTARREKISNPNYVAGSTDWKKNRQYADYSSASIKSRGLAAYQFGTIEVRARIDTTKGSWPAIWTLGVNGEWPSCGEVDIMEFYLKSNIQSILANVAWGTATRWEAKWDGSNKPLSYFLNRDPLWPQKFHTWRMDWTKDSIRLYLDDELLNYTLLNQTLNGITPPVNPFLQKHYFLLNLAIGSNGGNPSKSVFPITYEVDYIRVYQSTPTEIITNKDETITTTFTNNNIEIKTPVHLLPLNVAVYSVNGHKLRSFNIDSDFKILSLDQFPKGIFFLKATNNIVSIHRKFAIN